MTVHDDKMVHQFPNSRHLPITEMIMELMNSPGRAVDMLIVKFISVFSSKKQSVLSFRHFFLSPNYVAMGDIRILAVGVALTCNRG